MKGQLLDLACHHQPAPKLHHGAQHVGHQRAGYLHRKIETG